MPMGPSVRRSTRSPTAFAVVAAALVLALAACGRGTKNTGVDAGQSVSGSIPPEQAARVIAKVGDRSITVGDFAASLEHMDHFDRLRYQSPERRLELLQELIRVQLLADEAVAKGYDKDPIAAQELRAVLRDAVLEDAKKNARAPADIPAAEVHAYFDAHRADYKDPERRRFSLLVARDEASAAAAFEAYKKNPTVANWGEVLRSRSLDSQARANVPLDMVGDVGFVSPPGDPRGSNPRIPEEVRVVGFGLAAPGDVHPMPVKAGGKVFLVRFSQKVDARERSFEEAERTIRVKLAQDEIGRKEEELLAALRKEHPVQIDEAALAAVKIESPVAPPGDVRDAGTKD
jgi:hypothetical protein